MDNLADKALPNSSSYRKINATKSRLVVDLLKNMNMR